MTTEEFMAEFLEFAPEFQGYSNRQRLLRFVETARAIHDIRKTATFYIIAHLITLDRVEGNETVTPPGQEVFGAQNLKELYFGKTSYGRLFLQVEERTPSFALSARVFGGGNYPGNY